MIQIITQKQLQDAIWAQTADLALALSGQFTGLRLPRNPNVTTPVALLLDLTAATLTGDFLGTNLPNVSIKGGTLTSGSLKVTGHLSLSVDGLKAQDANIDAEHGGPLSVINSAFVGGAGCAIGATKVTGLLSEANAFDGMVGDCHQIKDSPNITVRKAIVRGGLPTPTAHPDFIQAGSVDGTPMTNWLIEDNDVDGPTQGLFLPGGVVGIARRNRLNLSFDNGISVGSGTNLTLQDNILTGKGRIIVYAGGKVAYLGGDTVGGLAVDAVTPAPPPDPRDVLIMTLQTTIKTANAQLAADHDASTVSAQALAKLQAYCDQEDATLSTTQAALQGALSLAAATKTRDDSLEAVLRQIQASAISVLAPA